MTLASRRHLLLSLTGLATSVALPARAFGGSHVPAQGGPIPDPADLTWDEPRARALWHRSPPPFVVVDNQTMQQSGMVYQAPLLSLTDAEKAEVVTALQAASAFYKSRGLGPPELPMANDAFHVFFVKGMGDVNGSSGPAVGSSRLASLSEDLGAISDWAFGVVPRGNHMLLNADNYFAPSDKHPWAPRTTLAHELLHTVDRYMVGQVWINNFGKWWTEGNVEAVAPFALAGLGYRPQSVWRAGERDHAQNVGMRPYDYPLTLKGVPDRLPAWVKNGRERSETSEGEMARSFFASNATYFTSSFWRFLLQEEAPARPPLQPGAVPMPGNFELLSALRQIQTTAADRAAAGANPHMDAGVPALDRFLRNSHPTWGATGLYRAFPAFIAHFVEWPDQVIKSRQGLFYHPVWMDVLFMDGARYHELTPDEDINVELTVLPLAAKAIRFEVPSVAGLVGDHYPPVTITVSVLDGNGQSNPIDNIHVGLRGQCLGNGYSQPGRYGRVRRWISIKATPLNRSKVANETVLSFINVAPDPTATQPVRIRVTVSLQVASSTGQPSYHPLPASGPTGAPIHVPPSVAPRGDGEVPVIPVEIGSDKTTVVIVKNADLVRLLNDALDTSSAMSIPRESEDGPQLRQGMLDDVLGAFSGVAATPMAGPPTLLGDAQPAAMQEMALRSIRVELAMPTTSPTYVGAVAGCEAAVEWYEPAYEAFAQYGVSPGVRIETDAVQLTITSRNEGAIQGVYSADFDRGSQNTDGIFRGRIEGRFTMAIARDEPAGDEQMPSDMTAFYCTDFFVGMARTGVDTQNIGAMLRAQSGQLSQNGSSTGGAATSGSGTSGSGTGASTGGADNCRISRAEFEVWFQETYSQVPNLSRSDLADIRSSLLENWTVTEQYICSTRAGS